MTKRFLLTVFALLSMTAAAFAQTGGIAGTVTDRTNGEALIGATVFIQGTSIGTTTNTNGEYMLRNVPAGLQTVIARYVGYEESSSEVNVPAGEAVGNINFELVQTSIMSRSIAVVSSRAKFRETPVAFSNIEKVQIQRQLGSRDLPMILNQTPGVYATEQGGGAGDARINIRGFNQRNVAVMINGVPVNDMENGWVYWSNWDGLGDVTASMQVQRGLGAGKIANPYIGGTMNIITDPAQQKPGIMFKQEAASGGFLKSSLIGNTGDLGGFAASFAAVRKTGDGLVDKTWTDAWAYYLGLRYNASEKHQFELYAIGAPQMHGQRSYKQPIALFDKELAKDADVPQDVIDGFTERGIEYNPHWGPVSGDYNLDDYYWGGKHDRMDNSYLMERENYYHKPQINLNWHWLFNDKMSLTNVFYVSIGKGGGSGPYGRFPDEVAYNTSDGQINFQGMYDYHRSDAAIDPTYSSTESRGAYILRNSVNEHFWYGYLGTFEAQFTDKLLFQGGIDYRNYVGQHWREVRNLLGADYYIDQSDKTIDYNANPNAAIKRLGDKIAYHNDGLVNWFGGFAQVEYKAEKTTLYLNTSLSQTGMKRKDYFRTEDMPNGSETDWENMMGYTLKGGANYNVTKTVNVFANAGYYSRPPDFRNVYYYDNSKLENITNEKVMAFEVGTGYNTDIFYANLDLYYTMWNDKAWYTSSYVEDPETGKRTYFNYNLAGLDALHMGAELSFGVRPHDMVKIYGWLSLGDWAWANDVTARFSPEEDPTQEFTTDVYADGLKVGDAAQKTAGLGVNFFPIDGLYLNVNFKYFWDHYANFDPARRTNADDDEQSWLLPSYSLLDAHVSYDLPLNLSGVTFEIFGHGYNLLDAKYISDASDGSTHDAQSAQVYVGIPMRINAGLIIKFEPRK